MSEIPDSDKTQLLFKEFTGVTNVKQASPFPSENFAFTDYIFGSRVFSDSIPALLPSQYTSTQLDICNNIIDGTFIDFDGTGSLPNFNLRFYKKIQLDPAESGSLKSWYLSDGSGGSLLANAIPFKYDPVNSSYVQKCYREITSGPPPVYFQIQMYSSPLFWLFDYKSGFLQFYGDETTLGNFFTATNGPRFSFFQYIGPTGVDGGGGGSDISGVDISNIQINLEKLNRMILPDGYVDISGTDYDLCGNEVIRTYYTYNRAQMFVGYDNLPILDGSAVDHTQDPSHNNIKYELDVSGNTHLNGKLVSGFSVDSSGNYSVGFGFGTKAYGDYSFTSGASTEAIGRGSFAQGLLTKSIGTESHSEGFQTEAIGNYSHAKGQNTKAIGIYSHSSGIGTIIGEVGGTSIGKYNDISNNVLFVVGCGGSPTSRKDSLYITANDCVTHINKKLDVSGDLVVSGHSQLQDVSCSNLDVSGILNMKCNNIIDVSNIYFCNTSAILGQSPGVLTISGDLDMSMNQITTIADATDNSGVPSWGQVQSLISSGIGSYWIQNGTDLYYNTGTVGINIAAPNNNYKLDVNGSTNVAENLFVSMTPNQSIVSMDKNLYTRNTNLIDTLKVPYEIFYDEIWKPMITANENGIYTNPTTGQQYTLSSQNPGKPQAVPTFSSAWGPCVIPIAYLDINQNYGPAPGFPGTPFNPPSPPGPLEFQTAYRPDIANTSAYFTIKFSEPYDTADSAFPPIDWKAATFYFPNGSFKSGIGAITEQTITFEVGYIDSYQLSAPNGGSADIRNPKPFIKIISTNIGNLKCLTGITVIPDPVNPTVPANINNLTQNMKYYGFDIETPKIGGICRIIIAESCPGVPADKSIRNKAWLLLEQQWNVEPWQGSTSIDNEEIIRALIGGHVIDVRMYANNLGDLNVSRSPPFTNNYNTDWQLVTPNQISSIGDYSWDKFVLPMGNFANPPVFNIPTSPPVTDIPYTLMVGGTQCPDPTTGILNGIYPRIIEGANLWEVWLNLKNWPYGITTTEEVFENNVDICGNLLIEGSTDAQAITATDITCNNLDALNSIDVGPNQKLTIIEDKITSTTTASTPLDGLKIEANNIYIKFNPWNSAGGATPAGLTMDLGDSTSNTQFRMRDIVGSKLFSVEGSGLMQTQNIYPFTNMTYNIGYKGPNPIQDLRYKNLYIGNIDTSGNIDISGNLTVDGDTDLNGNLTVDGDTDLNGNVVVQDLSATNIDVSNNLNVDGLITGIGDTKFVEYKDFSNDISANVSGWYCISRTNDTNTTGGRDNARGLFIVDDNTSGKRQQIIFYAGTSYSRGNYINVIANNWYGTTPTITNLKLETGTTYAGTNLYIYREATVVNAFVYVRLYENTRITTTGGQWELTAIPHSVLTTTPVNLDLTYNPNNQRANAVSSLDTVFNGDVSMNTLNLTNLDVQNTIKTKILEVEDSTGNDILKVDGPNKTSTFYFDSSTSSGSLILNDTNGNTSTFIKQQGTTVVMEGSDLQVGSVGVEKDINAAEVTGWFNTRDYFAIASFIGSAGTSAPGIVGYTAITNNCPGGVKIIPTPSSINIEPPATGVYTITVTGLWSGDAWGSGDQNQPMIILSGPAYHPSTPVQATAFLSVQSASRYYNSGYNNYQTFNWTGRMVDTYNSSQAQYQFYVKNNGASGAGILTYTGQIQVTRIC